MGAPDLDGKTVLLTGATKGIGLVAAREIARTGAALVLVARDAARGQATVEDVRVETGNDRVELITADLSVQAEVRRAAAEFRARHQRLDVLVNNAGAIFAARETTADGLEATFALNHLSYFLLTSLLLDLLKASAPARVVNVASAASMLGRIDFDDLELKRRHDRLHVLVNNAGAIFMKREVSADGIEKTFAVDHLAYFLLTNLLLDVLKASAPARVVNVASAASAAGHLEFDDLQLEHRYSGWRAYSNAKLANILFSNELARRLSGNGVTSNALHPGVVATGFGRNDNGLFTWLVKLGRPFMVGEEKGARTSIHLASSPQVEGVTGKYFVNRKPRRPPREALDEGVARRLWEVSAKMTGVQLALTDVKAGAPDTRRAAST